LTVVSPQAVQFELMAKEGDLAAGLKLLDELDAQFAKK
jgi:hypothetical protein